MGGLEPRQEASKPCTEFGKDQNSAGSSHGRTGTLLVSSVPRASPSWA